MSFRCDHCTRPNPREIAPATSEAPAIMSDALPRRVAISRAEVRHPQRRGYNDRILDRGGKGTQITREASLCTVCADHFAATGKLPPIDTAPITHTAPITEAEKVGIAVNAFAALAR